MLNKGNSKLGKSIYQWGIPAGVSCPGKSDLCDARCYAQKGFYLMPNVSDALYRNWEISRQDDFVERMNEDIRKKKAALVRIHTSGDLYDSAYTDKWFSIIRSNPGTRFFTYTRSWRIPDIRKAITKGMNGLNNLRMWWSADVETGFPTNLPKKVKVCYMSISDEDLPDKRSHLVFRDYPLRNNVVKWMNSIMVCPPENGVTNLTCEKCSYCYNVNKTPRQINSKTPRRTSLPVVR